MKKFATIVLGLSVLIAGGCANEKKTAWYEQPEPVAASVAVYSDAGLGASDALGHRLFVENTDYRVASAAMVFEMAAADELDLNLDRLAIDSTLKPSVPRQVIVSGEGVIPDPLNEQATVTSVETNDFE